MPVSLRSQWSTTAAPVPHKYDKQRLTFQPVTTHTEEKKRINSWPGEVHAMVIAVISDDEESSRPSYTYGKMQPFDYKGVRSWNPKSVESEVAYYLQ